MVICNLGDLLGTYTGDKPVRLFDTDGNIIAEYRNPQAVDITYMMCNFKDFNTSGDTFDIYIEVKKRTYLDSYFTRGTYGYPVEYEKIDKNSGEYERGEFFVRVSENTSEKLRQAATFYILENLIPLDDITDGIIRIRYGHTISVAGSQKHYEYNITNLPLLESVPIRQYLKKG